MAGDSSGDPPPRLPDDVIEAVHRHAAQPELAVYSLQVWTQSQSEWRYDPEFEVDALRGALSDLPDDVLDAEGVEAVCQVAERVYRERDGQPD